MQRFDRSGEFLDYDSLVGEHVLDREAPREVAVKADAQTPSGTVGDGIAQLVSVDGKRFTLLPHPRGGSSNSPR